MQAWIKEIAPNLYTYRAKFFTACSATVEMFWKAGLIAFVIGLLFGILLVITRKGGIRQNPLVYQATNLVINIFRSIPFIILLIFRISLFFIIFFYFLILLLLGRISWFFFRYFPS